MKRYVIEREIQGVGGLTEQQRQDIAAKSNEALAQLGGKAQWIHSYVADNKTFCIYLAEDEAAVREHARISGFPANKVTEIAGVIDPMTAR
jgi:Nickel responsive protein SCO4226-like